MASINFLPVCSNCHKVIYDVIDHEPRMTEDGDPRLKVAFEYDISPPVCPECGEVFTQITIPRKLPFDNTKKISWFEETWKHMWQQR